MKTRIFIYTLLASLSMLIAGVFNAIGAVMGAADNLPIANATALNIRSLHDFHFKKSVMNRLYKNYGDGFNTLDILRLLNRYEMVSNETMTYEEEGYDMRTITVGDTVSCGTTGTTATFNLHADDLDAAGRYYPRVGFTVMFGNVVDGFVQARIESIASGPVFYVKPYDANKALTSTYLYIGAEVGVFDSAWGVETGQPVGTSKGYWERTFYAQIFKETLTFGGMELAKQKWVEVEGLGFFNKELARVEFALDRQEEAAILMGQAGTNITATSSISSSSTANYVYKNKGIWSWIDELGGELTYTTTPDFTDFDEAAAYLESVGVTDSIVLVLAGGDMYRKLENMSVEWFTDPTGTGDGSALTGDFLKKNAGVDGGMDIEVNFRAIKKAGLLFVLHKLPAFTNPFQFGISTYKLNNSAIMIPMTYVKEGKTGVTVPNLSANYVGVNGYSRKRIVASMAGMDGFHQQNFGNPIISTIDGNNTYWLSHVMFPFVEAYKALIWRPTA
jgi:hypothetical protein